MLTRIPSENMLYNSNCQSVAAMMHKQDDAAHSSTSVSPKVNGFQNHSRWDNFGAEILMSYLL